MTPHFVTMRMRLPVLRMRELPCQSHRLYLVGGLPQPHEIHLDAKILHQELPGDAAHRVEGVVRVGPGGAGQQEVPVRVAVHLVHLALLLTLHQQRLQAFALS